MGVLQPLRNVGTLFVDFQLPLTWQNVNPLLQRELRRYEIAWSPETLESARSNLHEYTKKIGCLVPLCIGIVGVICMCSGVPYLGLISPIGPILLYGAVAFTLLANLYYILVAVQSAGQDIASPDWDTVRVTMLSKDDIIRAKYTVGLLRVWKITVIETGLRTFVGVFLLAFAAWASLWARSLSTLLLTWLYLALPVIVFVLEPFWRTRAITALGVAIAARFQNVTFAILAAFGAILALIMALVAILIGVFLLFNRVMFVVRGDGELTMLLAVGVVLAGGGILFGFYRLIGNVSLRRASALVAHSE
jgi:hypothetical protein